MKSGFPSMSRCCNGERKRPGISSWARVRRRRKRRDDLASMIPRTSITFSKDSSNAIHNPSRRAKKLHPPGENDRVLTDRHLSAESRHSRVASIQSFVAWIQRRSARDAPGTHNPISGLHPLGSAQERGTVARAPCLRQRQRSVWVSAASFPHRRTVRLDSWSKKQALACWPATVCAETSDEPI
jgi:hypothetical protein